MTLFVYASEKRNYAPILTRDTRRNEPGEVVGWIDKEHGIAWVCSPHRDDKRTGVIRPVRGPHNVSR